MKLYEILTGAIGESYERAYAWAESEDHAKRLFRERHNRGIARINLLMDSRAAPFCTALDCAGWPEEESFIADPSASGSPANVR
jgi:hypothetical protein